MTLMNMLFRAMMMFVFVFTMFCSHGFCNPTGYDVVTVAERYKGVPYVYGGSSPETGFDCSGFVQYVFAQLGIALPRTADYQAGVGKPVTEYFLPGDLVFFSSNGYEITHVGIYVGNGQFIHASSGSERRVTYDTLDREYRRDTYAGATRIVE